MGENSDKRCSKSPERCMMMDCLRLLRGLVELLRSALEVVIELRPDGSHHWVVTSHIAGVFLLILDVYLSEAGRRP